MICNTQTFWSYVCNESSYTVDQIRNLLTRKDYDFDNKITKINDTTA